MRQSNRRKLRAAVALTLAFLTAGLSADSATLSAAADEVEVIPLAPTLVREFTGAAITVALPSVPGVTYSHSSTGHVTTVVAAPAEGHVLATGVQTEWALLVPEGSALREVTPAEPLLTETRLGERTVSFPADEGVRYAPTRSGDIVTITATARPGHIISAGSRVEWTLDLADEPERKQL